MGFNSVSIARGLALLGLTLGLTAGPVSAATTEGGYATADLARLAGLLGQRGWRTRADGGGNLLIFRSRADLQLSATAAPAQAQTPTQTPAQSVPQVDTSLLAKRLPSHGWIVQRDATGTLTLFPPASGNRGLPRPDTAPRPATDVRMAQLATRLEAGGWTVRRDAAAGLYFYREVAAPRRPGSLGQGAIASRAAVAQPAPHPLVVLGEGLKHRDRGIEPEVSGTLTLRPPAGSPATHPAAAAPERVAEPSEPQIREALTKRGWDLRRDAAGYLFLTPRA